ncbi:MAG: hypothetical protein ACREV5_20645 [Steroidobacter sp.]
MGSHVVRLISPQVALACAAIFALAACERGAQQDTAGTELAWARAALERNPQIEVVASDNAAGVFTIRDKKSGEVQIVKISDIAAAPVSQLAATAATRDPPVGDPQPPRAASESTAQSEAPEPARTSPDASTPQVAQTQPEASQSSTPVESSAYTIERTDGQLRVSGPGVSIVSSGTPTTGAARNELAERAAEPIICEGRRMLHFDNRNIYVDGDAITVRDGCELFITNSRIVASGTGIIVRDAVVHVSNSHIEGAAGSFDADADSKLYVRGSTFQGLSRRDELAMVQDQGGNRWR